MTGAARDGLDALASEPERFDLFQALRLVEAASPEQARLGEGRRARAEPARLGQDPYLAFPPAMVTAFEPRGVGRAPRLATPAIGLFGPHGPLPLHLTAHALDRKRRHGDVTFARFCDVLHHRFAALFHRAWARARPTVDQDRPAEARFPVQLGALAGLATPAFRNRTALPDRFVLFGAGLLGRATRPPEALERLASAYFRVPARLEEFVGEWLQIPVQARSRLGSARLGQGAVAGIASYQRAYRVRLHLGPMGLAAFRRFLPNGPLRPVLAALVDLALGREFVWDARLVLRRDEVPAARLDGTAQLGWTSWLARDAPRTEDAGDLVLQGR